jgi:hypothetical protein
MATIKQLEDSLNKSDFLVEIQYNKRTVYEIRSDADIKKNTITSTQFNSLKSKFNFIFIGSNGMTVRTHYYKR